MICSKQIGQQISAPRDSPIFRIATTAGASGGGETPAAASSAGAAVVVFRLGFPAGSVFLLLCFAMVSSLRALQLR
jgi:hypothetical protein